LRTTREQRCLLPFLLQPLGGVVDALLHGTLFTAQLLRLCLAGSRFLLELTFLPSHLQHFLNALIERLGQLGFPRVDLGVARVSHRLRGLVHLVGRVLRTLTELVALLTTLLVLLVALLTLLLVALLILLLIALLVPLLLVGLLLVALSAALLALLRGRRVGRLVPCAACRMVCSDASACLRASSVFFAPGSALSRSSRS
jgi:hypothetical protein